MCEHGYWRKLFIGTALIVLSIIVGCNTADINSDNPYFFPEADIMTMDELAINYVNVVGKRVILEGQLGVENNSEYYVVARRNDADGQHSTDFRLALHFTSESVDEMRMRHCLGGTTLVTGYVEESRRIRVEFVNLKADVLVHSADSCYQFFE